MTPDLEVERLKIRFIAAYERLQQRGLITEEEFEAIIDLLDRLDEVDEAELKATLGRFQALKEQLGKDETT
ncbi:MAG: hypothetical protein GX961_05390 [Firmicutes bacterium]|uniref:hypothetical protein n=1 Tax=Limnochorda pilosa TaxID=1555112 RepID=UPI0017BF30FF|nr:hypothetical protein [Limnochorda pilosa]NMA71335.1 hypothetical protein [Bacillota bacterium]